MEVLVTGASGFIGGSTCAELLGRGHAVAALVRRTGSEPAGTRAVAGDLTDAPALAAALAGGRPDAVVHLAAEIGSQRNAAKLNEVNVEGTRRLLQACGEAGAPRFVFVSTSVKGDPRGAQIDEDSPGPVETAYGKSKAVGEELVAGSGLEYSIIRPGHVYGPAGWYVTELIGQLRKPGRFGVIGNGENWWDVVHVDDVASAIADAVEKAPNGGVYHVVDDEPISQRDFIALTAESLGMGAPRRTPVALAKLMIGGDPTAVVTRSARNSNARIKRELAWEPRYPTAREGVPAAVAEL
ncbi:MAG: NAD(P)-dependent oxidoreductase [Thermoleophilaceae bacterium]|nr:NAD(P)-dependent oxidoreductase [Thermoleophilaceae bacterium]